jgi:hypothetical protein
MAFVRIEHCWSCRKETRHINGKCEICLELTKKEKVAKWDAQSTNDKLNDLRIRIEALERDPRRC